jgi:malonyl CoA-acyl carrier protein transacylase
MAENGVTSFIEFGPLDVLTRLLPWFKLDVAGIAVGTPDALTEISQKQ